MVRLLFIKMYTLRQDFSMCAFFLLPPHPTNVNLFKLKTVSQDDVRENRLTPRLHKKSVAQICR